MDGQGEQISQTALAVGKRILDLTAGLSKEVGIFPTLVGGLQFESDTFEVAISPDGSVVVTDYEVENAEQAFSHATFETSVWAVIRSIGDLVERRVTARKPPEASEREERLESILRRILPISNTIAFNPTLRADLAREFTSMRGSCGRRPTTQFSITETLMKYDGPLLALADAEGRKAVLMRLDEQEAGHYFSLAVPAPQVMDQLIAGDICMRQACLHELTDTYVCDEISDGSTATILEGPIREHHLPLMELSVKELIDEACAEMEHS